MFQKATASTMLGLSLLSACGSLSLGDTSTLKAQEDAIFSCAKAEGDQIFPITTGVTIASGTVASVQIESTERVSPALAAKINACAAATLALAQADVPVEATSNVALVAETTPVSAAPNFTAPAGCIPGGGVLQGGVGYCVGTTD